MNIRNIAQKYLTEQIINEAPTMTRQHYSWFLEIFADACKKNSIKQTIYLKLVTTLMDDFAKTNAQFKPQTFMSYAKKLYKADGLFGADAEEGTEEQ
jgi:hypothetical protein